MATTSFKLLACLLLAGVAARADAAGIRQNRVKENTEPNGLDRMEGAHGARGTFGRGNCRVISKHLSKVKA